ncbi:hypothetical protein RND81_10G055000 [Saponaria officinalis]|uniref:Uncharacterized protein n=1 Tax=Saponaria officinalis TaxID=3572 RepID=A0AAW1HZM1_SAPOF
MDELLQKGKHKELGGLEKRNRRGKQITPVISFQIYPYVKRICTSLIRNQFPPLHFPPIPNTIQTTEIASLPFHPNKGYKNKITIITRKTKNFTKKSNSIIRNQESMKEIEFT